MTDRQTPERTETDLVARLRGKAMQLQHAQKWGIASLAEESVALMREAADALASRAAAPPELDTLERAVLVILERTASDASDEITVAQASRLMRRAFRDFQAASPQERPTPAAPVEVGSSAPMVSAGGSNGMATLSGTDRGHGEVGRREGGGALDSGVRAIYAGNGAAHDLITRQLMQRLHLTESDRTDILDVLRLCDLRSLSVVELDRLSIRTGCDTELTRAADFELKRRGYVFDPDEQQWKRSGPATPAAEGQE